MSNNPEKRICLWSGPRNISTALMYSFAQRSDTIVVDEPLYAHYLNVTDADQYHPGAEEILNTMENSGEIVVEQVLGHYSKPVVFFKQMTHHLVDLDKSFLEHTINFILTRDPREMLPSYARRVDKPTMRDVGYAKQLELLRDLQLMNQIPTVIVSKEILKNPKEMLTKLCKRIGIPFQESMLSWKEGAHPEDGVWAKYWYETVHHSTGFKPYQPKKDPFPEHLIPLLEDCLPHYQELCKHAI